MGDNVQKVGVWDGKTGQLTNFCGCGLAEDQGSQRTTRNDGSRINFWEIIFVNRTAVLRGHVLQAV
jgi:hypothetical protein